MIHKLKIQRVPLGFLIHPSTLFYTLLHSSFSLFTTLLYNCLRYSTLSHTFSLLISLCYTLLQFTITSLHFMMVLHWISLHFNTLYYTFFTPLYTSAFCSLLHFYTLTSTFLQFLTLSNTFFRFVTLSYTLVQLIKILLMLLFFITL